MNFQAVEHQISKDVPVRNDDLVIFNNSNNRQSRFSGNF